MAVSTSPAASEPYFDELVQTRKNLADGGPLWAILLHDLLTRPTGFPAPARFAALMLIDGALVLLTLLFVVLAIPGAVSDAFYNRPSLVLFFSLTAVFTICLTGLYWRSWRFLSFGDGIAISTAVLGGIAAGWSLCFILSVRIRSAPLDALGFALLFLSRQRWHIG